MSLPLLHLRRRARSRRASGGLAALIACLAMLGAAAPAGARARRAAPIAPSQTVALLFAPHRAFAAPRPGARGVGQVAMRRPITGERTVLPVLGRRSGPGGQAWLRVRLPGRPNSHTGWILERQTRLSAIFWHLLIDLRARRVTAYLDGRSVRSFPAVVGKPSTPTPTGQFFVEETLRMNPGDPGGPFALALSARSDFFRRFDGGPGQIAVHGRANLGGTLGQAQSHGCVRLATPAITWLAHRFGPGTPVTIRAR